MKLRIESANENADEEIVIYCREVNSEIKLIKDIIENIIEKSSLLELTYGDGKCFVPKNDIIFFETDGGKVTAHTENKLYYTDYRLFELEKLLPRNFVRASKSCILNASYVSEIRKNLAGASEVRFRNTYKKVYVSRKYYKVFKENIDEMRGNKL